jgi:adenosylcobinamide-phosphate synthase
MMHATPQTDVQMSFLAVLVALLIEQARPLSADNWVHRVMGSWGRWVWQQTYAGSHKHAWATWLLTVGVPTALAIAMFWALATWSLVLAWCWNVAVLYLTLGFRQFSFHFTEIRDALEQGDEAKARDLLAQWKYPGQSVQANELPRSEIVRHVIEHSVLAAHRHVLGVFLWFAVLSALGLGPAGAVLYRFAEWMPRFWKTPSLMEPGVSITGETLDQVAQQTWAAVDFVPARATSLGFAVVGNFEDAVDSWRNHAQKLTAQERSDNDGVILAATSGAMGVRLGGQSLQAQANPLSEEIGGSASTPGIAPQTAHLRSVVGLVWRSVVLWMVLLALLTLAKLLG